MFWPERERSAEAPTLSIVRRLKPPTSQGPNTRSGLEFSISMKLQDQSDNLVARLIFVRILPVNTCNV